MARLSDIPKIYRAVGVRAFSRRVWDEVNIDNLFIWASALAYSWLFAIFPFFIFLLALVHYLPEQTRDEIRIDIKQMVADRFPRAVNSMLWKDIEENHNNLLNQPAIRGRILYFGLLVALWAASGGTAMTMTALDYCYELERGRSYFRHRLVAMLLTIVITILLLAVICLLPVATFFKGWVVSHGISPFHGALLVFDIARWLLSIVLMILILCVIYYNGPAIRHHFCLITPGAVFVVIVWVVLGLVFRLYIDRIGAKGYNQTYGTVGGVAILLLFFYIDALVLLIGAEINSEIDFEVLRVRRGSKDFRQPEDFSSGAPMAC
jgi:membrane protein